jgi:hypothetical protein
MSTTNYIQNKVTEIKCSKLATNNYTLDVEHETGSVTFFFDTKQGLIDFRRKVIDAVYELLNKSVPKEAA